MSDDVRKLLAQLGAEVSAVRVTLWQLSELCREYGSEVERLAAGAPPVAKVVADLSRRVWDGARDVCVFESRHLDEMEAAVATAISEARQDLACIAEDAADPDWVELTEEEIAANAAATKETF